MDESSDSKLHVLSDPAAKESFDKALRDRHNGKYRDAIDGLERAIEVRMFSTSIAL